MDGLQAGLKRRHVTMIALGGVIGAGLFVGSGAVINQTGPAAVLSYLLAGILVVLVMRMLGEMAVANPSTGSFADYARFSLGNWAGFTTGWLYWWFWVIVLAIEAVAGAEIIQRWVDIPIWASSLVLMLLLTLTNLWSVKSYGEFEFWFASIKVAAIIAFIVLALAFALGLTGGDVGFSHLTSEGFAPEGMGKVLTGVVIVIFAFVGAEIATIAAAESDEPERSVTKATNSVIGRVLVFYVLSVFLIVSILPWDSTKLGESPFVAALDLIGIPAAADIMNAVVLTAVLSCLNSGIYVASRMMFALANRGDAPQWTVKLNSRGVPARAILLATSFGYVSVIARRAVAGDDLPVAGELVRRGGAVRVPADRGVGAADAGAARARGPGEAAGAHVGVSVPDLGGDRRDRRRHRVDGGRRRRARPAVVEPRQPRGRADRGVGT